jgi:hypothetical protein
VWIIWWWLLRAQNGFSWLMMVSSDGGCKYGHEPSSSIKGEEILNDCKCLKTDFALWNYIQVITVEMPKWRIVNLSVILCIIGK